MMPRAARICAGENCVNLVRSKRYCPECKKKLQGHHRRYDDHRPSAARRGYDAEWRKIRDRHLQENPFCIDCGQPATEVDHLVALADGGTHDKVNLRSRCKRCHSRKTAKMDGGFGNERKGRGVAIAPE